MQPALAALLLAYARFVPGTRPICRRSADCYKRTPVTYHASRSPGGLSPRRPLKQRREIATHTMTPRSPISIERLRTLKEDRLRTDVLIPLFRALGYHDVVHNHGAQERGKDITMWKPDPLLGRENFGVVAKAGPISGRTAGKGSAGEVISQIQQCLRSPFTDPITGQNQIVKTCIVVTNGTIREESITAIRSAIGELIHHVRFIDGETLAQAVAEHLPSFSAMDHLDQAREQFKRILPNHAVAARFDETGVTLELRSAPGIEIKHPLVDGSFAFPDTEEGREALERLTRHFTHGEPVEIEGRYLESFELPPEIASVVGEGIGRGGKPSSIQLGPRQSALEVTYTVSVLSETGELAELQGVRLRAVRVGTEAVTLSNEAQKVPWHFCFTIEPRSRSFHMSLRTKLAGWNVKRQLDAVRFLAVLAHGGTLRLTDEDTGLSMGTGVLGPGTAESPGDGTVQLLEDLVLIQSRTKSELSLPNRPITEDELETIAEVYAAVSRGRVSGTPGVLRADMHRERIEDVIAIYREGVDAPPIIVTETRTAQVCGAALDLGRVVTVIRGLYVNPDEAERVRAAKQSAPHAEFYEVSLQPGEGASAERNYLKWLSPEEGAALEGRVAGPGGSDAVADPG